MELKSPISSLFLHAGKDLGSSPYQMPQPVPLLLTGNRQFFDNVFNALRQLVSDIG